MAKNDIMVQRVEELKDLITPFAFENMDEEAYALTLKLLYKLSRKRVIDISRGNVNNWAMGIIYAIAQINFMFDKAQDYWFTADELAEFFGGKKSTAAQKAKAIRDTCSIGMFDTEFVRQRISDKLQFGMTSNGFIVPMTSESPTDYFVDESVMEELEAHLIYEDACEKGRLAPPRSIAYQAEQEAVLQAKRDNEQVLKDKRAVAREKRECIAAENAEQERLLDLERQPRLF